MVAAWLKTLATLRFLELSHCAGMFFDGKVNPTRNAWKKFEKENVIRYYRGNGKNPPIKGVSFAVLTSNGCKTVNVPENRAWPLGAAADQHIAVSYYVSTTEAVRAEPEDLATLKVKASPNVAYVIQEHKERKAVIFRVYIGTDAAEMRRTVYKELSEEVTAPLYADGTMGFLVLVPTVEAIPSMREAARPLEATARIHVALGPTQKTLAEYIK